MGQISTAFFFFVCVFLGGTVDGSEILHQLRLVVSPIIYRVLYIPSGAGFVPSTVFFRYFGVL